MDNPLHDPQASQPIHFRIGTRGSDLAMWQAHFTKRQIEQHGGTVELIIISTQGDRIQNVAFDKMEGKGFFTKEIESALLEDRIDIAVHSHKDLETTSPEGLCIAAVPARGPVEDVLIMHPSKRDDRTPLCISRKAVVGTSSHRRRAQLQTLQSDLDIVPLRGNVPTRIEKLRTGAYDAIVLARAGIERLELDLSDLYVHVLPANQFVPAPAQGALGIQMRDSDSRLAWISSVLNDEATRDNIERERGVLRELEGGCMLPFGAHVMQERLRCFLETPDGPRLSEVHLDRHASIGEGTVHALSRLTNPLQGTVFLSKSSGTWPIFESLAHAAGLKTFGQSLIHMEATEAQWPVAAVTTDWLWLHSPSAVEAMKSLIPTFPGDIACAGKGTAAALAHISDQPAAWVGTGTPEKTHVDFAAILNVNDSRVFVPHSDRSMNRWAGLTQPERIVAWCAYQTTLNPSILTQHDVAVITSPSQWEAYAAGNHCASRIVTLGTSTAAAVKANGNCSRIEVASEPSEWETWLAVERAFVS